MVKQLLNRRSENGEQDGFWYQVAICGLVDSGQTKILKHISRNHIQFLPEVTAHIEKGRTTPRGINYRVIELLGSTDPSLSSLEGAHALILTASSEDEFRSCRRILLKIHEMFSGDVPLLVLIDQTHLPDSSLERPIELLGLADLLEAGLSNLRIFSVCKESGTGLREALDWLTSYLLTDEGDVKQLSPISVTIESMTTD